VIAGVVTPTRIHVSIARDETLNLDQPTIDHGPRLTVARSNHLGAGDPAFSELAHSRRRRICDLASGRMPC